MERDLTLPESVETQSAVAWGAVMAGAVAGLAASFVLMAIAGGFGLRLVSPRPGGVGDVMNFTPTLGAWMMAVQVISSALGGYLAGRLRTRWSHVHDHESHFRDTAHGLLAWAVSTLAGAILMASALAPLANRATAVEALAEFHASSATPAEATDAAARLEREENLTAQVSLFMGVGLLLGAFTASVAAAIGGLRNDEMHTVYWSKRAGV